MKALLTFMIFTCLHQPASACFWDHDTLAMEQLQFPNLLELITGYLPVHSQDYYQWIVQDRLARLEEDPLDMAAMDDLAVAHDKLGNPRKGVDLMLAKEKLQPGQYTTAANLGTLYIYIISVHIPLPWIK